MPFPIRATILRPLLAGLAATLAIVSPALAQSSSLPPLTPAASARIDALIARMTPAEKAGQLAMLSADLAVTGPALSTDVTAAIRLERVGSLLNAYGTAFTRRLQTIAVEETRLRIPLLFAFDVIHGHRTIFPIPLALASSFDPALVERTARIAAEEASAEGLHWTFAPMLDVTRDPRWGRVAEGPGEDPWLASRIAEAAVRGYQGAKLGDRGTIAATAKHLGAYGAPEAGRDYASADISTRTLREVYLPPFKAAVQAGIASVMPSFNDLAGVPATANGDLLNGILRDEWGFSGLVVSDYHAIPELVVHGVAGDDAEAAVQAFLAGTDIDMEGDTYVRYLADLAQTGGVPAEALDAAVRRVLELKSRLGLFDDPFRYGDPAAEAAAPTAEHLAMARDAARRSIVLLKNADQLLPLSQDLKRIAVIGPLGDAAGEMLGPWSGAGDSRRAVSILAGIRTAWPAATVTYAKGSSIDGLDRAGFGEAVAVARDADVVVLALGERASMSGEAASRARLDLPGVQQQLAEAVIATGKPVVVTLTSGRPLVVPRLESDAGAVLQTWFLGHEAGNAVADVLNGDWNPSARLPITVPREVGQVPIHYDHRPTGRPTSGSFYTSKYLDVATTPLRPFGFGLSYTTFAYGPPRVDTDEMSPSGKATVSVEVTNTGERAGEETVQLYIRQKVASVARPVLELKGIGKLTLEPGETGTATIALLGSDLAFVRRSGSFGTEPGEIAVFSGPNSADLQATWVQLLDQ